MFTMATESSADEPPFEIRVDGETQESGLKSKKSATLKANDIHRRGETRKAEVIDREGNSVFCAQTRKE